MPDELKLAINDYLPLRDVVFITLRQAILKGELAPGERLMEIRLANMLGVSRTPIREAIRKAMSEEHRAVCRAAVSPYGNGNAGERIAAKIAETVTAGKIDLKKKFYDLRSAE